MKKTFLDKADEMMFGHFNPTHEPVTTATLWSAFWGGIVVALVVFILQMCGVGKNTEETVIVLMALGLLAWIAWMTWDSIRAFGAWWQSAVYGLYLLVIFSDGTEKKAELTGTGLCGEKFWKDEDGNTHVEY